MEGATSPPNGRQRFFRNEEEFEALFRGLYDPLCRYAMTYLKDRDESEDLVQMVFVKLWQQRDQLLLQTSAKSYLYKAVYHECVSRARHAVVKDRYMQANLRQLEENSDFAHHKAEAAELENRIRLAVESLPEQCGRVFRLSRVHKLTYQEIAEVLNLSVKTVENHMGKALATLRLKLAEFLVLIFVWLCNF